MTPTPDKTRSVGETDVSARPVSEARLAELRDMTTRCHGSGAARDARMKRGIPWGALDAALRELQSRRGKPHDWHDLCRENKRLTDELQSLRAEVERLTSDRDAKSKRMWELGHECDALRARIASLEARNASLEKDAARYRWLRTAGAWESEIGMDELSKDPAKYDAAIDAAMKEGG